MNIVDELLREYRQTRSVLMAARLQADEEDGRLMGSMLSDVQLAIDWMEKGHNPGPRRGIHRRSGRQRTITVDPLHMQSYAQPAACGSPTTLSDHERFQIDDALSTLSDREKQAYILRYGLCFSIGQVAQEMVISRSSVQKMLERADQKIADSKASSLFLVG
ncbi:sigma factor-like helix-turn-helix DNA-binding protein [Paenibacillus cellulositrophicus]|uniref:sigma factor-like helix-turn-helix DNA-binding protein n=1 Tax=Paenibacillus cellulositrophicus TaxID=562959 RepID=UPI003F80CAFF